jgi:hypothetical protein
MAQLTSSPSNKVDQPDQDHKKSTNYFNIFNIFNFFNNFNIFNCFLESVLCCLTFLGPVLFLVLVIACNFYLILKPLIHSAVTFQPYSLTFSQARDDVARYWVWHGNVFHAHQTSGLENIPDEGPAILVYYHGAIPIDYAFLVSKILLEKRRIVRSDLLAFANKNNSTQ